MTPKVDMIEKRLSAAKKILLLEEMVARGTENESRNARFLIEKLVTKFELTPAEVADSRGISGNLSRGNRFNLRLRGLSTKIQRMKDWALFELRSEDVAFCFAEIERQIERVQFLTGAKKLTATAGRRQPQANGSQVGKLNSMRRRYL